MRVAGVGKIVINWWLLLLNYSFNDLFTHFSKIPYTTETNNTHCLAAALLQIKVFAWSLDLGGKGISETDSD